MVERESERRRHAQERMASDLDGRLTRVGDALEMVRAARPAPEPERLDAAQLKALGAAELSKVFSA
jgi:hypothetical protein